MLNMVVHYPVAYGRFHENDVLVLIPQRIKTEIVKRAENFFKEEGVSVALVPIFSEKGKGQVVIHCDKSLKTSKVMTGDGSIESKTPFQKLIDSVLLSVGGSEVNFSVQVIFCDYSWTT